MRVALCTWDTPDYADLAAVSQPGKEEYCARHGYTFIHDQRPLVDPLGFERLELVHALLPQYDLVLSVDTDAMIMNHTIKAERLQSPGIVISEDLFGINDGVFAASNTLLANQFLTVLLMMRRSGNSQDVFTHFASKDLYRPIIDKWPQREMNSYRNHLYGRPAWFTGNYQVGDWICQYPGIKKEDRIPLMLEAQKEIIR
jgi:hypothetical protein